MSDEQQLDDSDFGIRGIEKSQGYTEMPLADAPPQEDLALDATVENFIASRDDPAPIVEREFLDVQTGHKRPETETVSAEDAARNVANVREAERSAVEEQQNRDLAEALDQLRDPTTVAADTGLAQPDFTPQPDPEHALAVDREIAAALQNPKVRAALEQASQSVEQTKAQFQQATAELATQAQGVLTALFPDLSNLSGPQLQGALQYMQQSQPERFQQFQQLSGRAAQLVGVYRQQQAEQQQQMREVQAAQFKQFALSADDAFDRMNANVPAETRKAISREAVNIFKEFGISETELMQHYNSNPLLRSAAGQQIVAEAARYRLSQKGLSQHRANPVPQVVRPGSSAERVTRTEEALAEARAKLKPSMSAKEAAAYVIARRAASR